MIFLLALGCGDPVADAGEDEVAETTAVSETNGESSDNVEAGSESGTSESGTSESGTSESGTDDESDVAETTETTETGEQIDCTVLDEATCMGTEICSAYLGQPYTVTGDGTICLGAAEFIGCLFAEDACLPATGTLCMGDMAFHVDNLCPPPAGFESCDPPVDPVAPCMP
jgi:hypothetical protein